MFLVSFSIFWCYWFHVSVVPVIIYALTVATALATGEACKVLVALGMVARKSGNPMSTGVGATGSNATAGQHLPVQSVQQHLTNTTQPCFKPGRSPGTGAVAGMYPCHPSQIDLGLGVTTPTLLL